MKRKDIAQTFSIPQSTLSGIITNAAAIKEVYEGGEGSTFGYNSKRLRKSYFHDIDNALLTWFHQVLISQISPSVVKY